MKTKKQLRAEAIERLKLLQANDGIECNNFAHEIVKAATCAHYSYDNAIDVLIDLLTDDEVPEGDVVSLLREYANFWSFSHATHTQCGSNWEEATMEAIANMIERDYVRRDSLSDDDSNDTFSPKKVVSCDADTSNDNDLDLDSREKLEADLESLTKKWHEYDGNYMRIYSTVAYTQVKELLDRQAAITEQDCCDKCFNVQKQLEESLKENIRLEEIITDLTADRDKLIEETHRWKAKCDELQYSDDEHVRICADYHDMLVKVRRERNELQNKCDELQAACNGCSWPALAAMPDSEVYQERDKLSSQNKELRMQLKHMTYSRDLWKSRYTEVKPILDKNGYPIEVGNIVITEDKKAWRVLRLVQTVKHSVIAIDLITGAVRGLKPDWLFQ